MRVLLVEDDPETRSFIARGLEESGHLVEEAADGKEGLFLALEGKYDVMIVDRMLPGLDGLSIVEAARQAGRRAPILVLSALGEVDDRVEGLRRGGDDYLVKPFAFSELLARLEALVRRGDAETAETRLQVGDLEMDLLTRTVERGGRTIELQPREFRLLEYLMRHAGQRRHPHHAPGEGLGLPLRPADQRHRRPRQPPARKIDKGFDRPLLHTVRGAGYVLRESDPAAA